MNCLTVLRFALIVSITGIMHDAWGGRGGGGGARMSAARSGASRSAPSNYGSLRSSGSSASRSRDFDRSRSAGSYSAVDGRRDLDPYRGESQTFDTRRGGEVTVGVSDSGAVGMRGETAGGRNYAGVQGAGGDRVVVGENAQGDIVARTRGDGDGVVDVLPDGYDTIYVGDDPYYYRDHRYYWPYYYGGSVYYQEVYAPYGAASDDLPPGAETVTLDGVEYYVYDDVYYVKDGSRYVVSEPPAGAASKAGGAVSPANLMKATCAHVATYGNFHVDSTEEVERPGTGAATVKRRIFISRPDRIAAGGREGSAVTRFWYDGKTVTTLDEKKNVYASIDAPPTISAMIDLLQSDYGMAMPLSDLLQPDLCDALGPALDSMKYVGKETVAGRECHKLTLMTDDYYAQLWIDADKTAPLPRKVDILYTTRGPKSRYVGTITAWEAKQDLDPELFVFKAPDGAHKIEMLKRPD